MRRLLLLLGVFGALASAQSYRVVDARGKVVEVRSVERIVSLDGITTEILFALGVGEKVVGRDDSSYYPPEAQRLPSVGYQFRLSAEGILSLKPTLVIGREDVRPKEVVEQLDIQVEQMELEDLVVVEGDILLQQMSPLADEHTHYRELSFCATGKRS